MKKLTALWLCLALFCGCSSPREPAEKQYTATFIDLFDTVTTMIGRAESPEAFEAMIQPLHDELAYYHRLFDIYNEYEGINNLKTLNDTAWSAPVYVDTAILELLEDCMTYYDAMGGSFNYSMGSVLTLWHTAREDGRNDPASAYLPSMDALKEASLHIDPRHIVLDRESSTVFFKDPALRLDVGAIAKGWAVQKVAENAESGILISVGGNVCATGPKYEDGTPWAIGIQDPSNQSANLHVLNIKSGCVVTSGSYQRAYAVNGKRYHHIIDPATLYPGELWSSVTVVCGDSGLADALSTSLFLLDLEAGQALLRGFDAEALWVDPTGTQYYSPGFRALIRNGSR